VVDIRPLATLSNLRGLDISDTEVAELSPLAGLANLRQLDITGCTQVPATQVAAFRSRAPSLLLFGPERDPHLAGPPP